LSSSPLSIDNEKQAAVGRFFAFVSPLIPHLLSRGHHFKAGDCVAEFFWQDPIFGLVSMPNRGLGAAGNRIDVRFLIARGRTKMTEAVQVLVGTKKGAFIISSNDGRQSWSISGPHCDTWPINHVVADPATGTIYATGGNQWFGPAVWKSRDGGNSWTHSSAGLAYDEGETPVKAGWSLAVAGDRLYVGVEPAGLFVSEDGGETFRHIKGLQESPTRPQWVPGAGGLILHSIVPHPTDPDQLWVAISAAGVFYTADGGKTFEPRNKGTRCDFMPGDEPTYPEFGQCVHCVVMAPGMPNRLYQQNHCGMYRSDDGGQSWESIEDGLPSSFGFPVAAHPRNPDKVYFIPLNTPFEGRYMPGGKAAVFRSDDCGASYLRSATGLPEEGAYFGVLRQGLATDRMEPAGVYFGTNGGVLYGSANDGRSWSIVAQHLPVIHSVETHVTG
jgi:hypothetical protein